MNELQQEFERFYLTLNPIHTETTFLMLPEPILMLAETLAEKRANRWQTSTAWGRTSELSGFVGEVCAQKALGYTTEEAFESYEQGLGHGDGGADVVLKDGLAGDVKTTIGQACVFKVNRNNQNYGNADVLIMVHIHRLPKMWQVNLLGWAWVNQVEPFIKWDKPPYEHRGRFRFETLEKQGLVKPIRQLTERREAGV